MNYWLVKAGPHEYTWEEFEGLGTDYWDGVRNYQARNNMKAMQKDDLVFFYRSVKKPAVVGLAKVAREYYQDPTTDDTRWVAVDLSVVRKLKNEVSLAQVKADERLQQIALVRQSRLSVMPLKKEEFDVILEISEG